LDRIEVAAERIVKFAGRLKAAAKGPRLAVVR
jgi:hypothetical protein